MSEKGQHLDIESAQHENNGNFDRSWRDEEWNMASGNRKLSVAAQEVALDEKVCSSGSRHDSEC